MINRAKTPTITTNALKAQVTELSKYPREALIFHLKDFDQDTLTISPQSNKYGDNDIVIALNGIIYSSNENIQSPDNVSLLSTGIGGIVDGITFTAANARAFLLWFFANETNTEVLGFGLTHKPYSTFTGPAGPSTALKGALVTFTGLTSAYQFTIGARVCVRNTNGTSPLYEWNWGTVKDIPSSTSLQIQMDNDSNYGTDITAPTGGEILQWDKFRPWVVSSSGQELYSDKYRLIGDCYTDTNGYFLACHRVDDPFRPTSADMVNQTSGTVGSTTLSAGRWIPLWANVAGLRCTLQEQTTLPATMDLIDALGSVTLRLTGQILNTNIEGHVSNLGLTSYARFTWLAGASTSSQKRIRLRSYQVNGGMAI